MAYDLLTTSGINSLVSSFITDQTEKRINPLTTKKSYYQKLDGAYTVISTKLSALNTVLSTLKSTDTSSTFSAMQASSSNTSFVGISASSSAINSSGTIRVNQLAKSDMLLSLDMTSSANSSTITAPGTHNFTIVTGDGEGGTLKSNVSVTFDTSDFTDGVISNKDVMTKIQNAINSDKAIITSSSVAKDASIGAGSFVLDLNGTETTISYSAGTYSEVLDSVVSQINDLSGIEAEKVADGDSNYKLKITVTDSSKYINIGNDDSGTLINDLGISTNGVKEIGSSGFLSASAFSPASGNYQLSLSTKNSGYDYRIQSLSDNVGSSALSSIGINLGSSRTSFVQVAGGVDTPGYIYDSSLLNSKFEFNGVQVERNSNSVSDLMNGVTVMLKSVMKTDDTTVSLTVEKDTDTVRKKIEDFVTKFNDIYSYLKTNLTTTDSTRGALLGDTSASSLYSLFSNIAYSTVSGIAADKINTLGKIGISFNLTSGISVTDSSALDAALKDKPDEVAALFNSTSGIATTLYSRINSYVGTSGTLQSGRKIFGESITYLSDRITSAQTKIDKEANALRNNYIQLQMQLASVLNMQSSFSGYFSSLS